MIVRAFKDKVIELGRLGENDARIIQFNVSDVLKEHPDAEFTVNNRRPTDGAAYPVDGDYVTVEEGFLYWTIKNPDLSAEGIGECEIVATEGDAVCKSEIYRTKIEKALDGSGSVPEPWESWVEQVKGYTDRAEDAAEDAEDSAEAAKDSEEAADGSAKDAEAYAIGKRGGTAVGETDPAYHNNSKYYSEQAGTSATAAAASAADALEHTQSVIHTWLETNIDPDSGYALDRTLTEPLEAAPADMVGSLKSAINPIALASLSWTDGKYLFVNSSHVVSEQSNEVYACTDYVLIPAGMSCHVHSWYSGYARTVLYNASKAWIADYQQTSGVTYGVIDIDIAATTADRYVRISCHVDKKASAYIAITEPMTTVVQNVQSLQSLSVLANGSRTSTSEQLSSLDNAVPNTVYTFTANVDSDTQPSAYGTLLTLNATRDNNGGHAQIFIAWDGKVYSRIKWVRSGVSGFSAWEELTHNIEKYQYADATMFERIGVIGDSFASGVIYPSDYTGAQADENYTHYEQSWAQCLGRMCGNTVINYSVGGCTTKKWMTNSLYGKPKMDTDDPCGLYILCLGINDSNANTGVALGTISDIGTSEDSFYRWYGDIVAAIKAHAPDALIVFSTYCRIPTAATSANYTAYNNAIKALAEYYEVPCLVLTDDPFFNSDFYMNHMQNSHPTAAQYSGYAKGINRLLARSIVDNYSYYCDYNSEPSIET